MRVHSLRLGAALMLGLFAIPVRAAETNDTAELFPAGTLAYLEFRQPDRLSREAAALLKGSALDDMPSVLAKFREKRGDNEDFFFDDLMVGYLSMLASPEVIAEFGRLQGGAVALTGFSKDFEPEVVGILLSGSSYAPTVILRMALTADPWMRRVAECEGISLYRERERNRGLKAKGQAAPPEPHGPTYALLPDGLIIGSTTDSVKDMIRRLKGKTADPSLASVAAFRNAGKLRNKPGLFGYADVGALHVQLEESMKTASPPAVLQWNWVKALLNLKAGKQATVSFTLQDGSVELNARIGLDSKETSPVLELLSDKKANVELLHYVPKDAGITLAVALPDGEKRWTNGLALADALAKAEGKRPAQMPSKQIAEIEEGAKLQFGKDLFARITDAVIVVEPLSAIAGTQPFHLLVFSTTDADAAKALDEDFLPKLTTLMGPAAKEVKREAIQGHGIGSLPFESFGPGKRLYFGRDGKTFVVGMNGKDIADSLTAGSKKAGLLGDAKTAAALKEVGNSSIVGLLPLSAGLPGITPMESQSRRFAPVAPGGAPPPPKKPTVDPIRVKLGKDIAKATESLPPGTLTLERTPDQMTLVFRQPNLKFVSAKIVDLLVESSLERILNPNTGGLKAPEAVPPPPPKQ
jgi:hypothetical protein